LPKNDDGEFELVLGNRQLISVFLIVVILLGVFFSMGYIVGRNSSPATESARNEKPKPDADSDTSDGSNPDADGANSGNDATPSTAPETTHPAAKPVQTTPAQTTPAQPTPAPTPPKPLPVRAQETKPKPSPSPAPAPAAVRPPVRAAAAGEPSGGQYWQVVATSRPDAEIIAEALGKKGFHVVLSPAPRDGIFRVLVGPLADASTQAQTRTGLESAGFKNPILRKY
jgi:cell division septation protein DedD